MFLQFQLFPSHLTKKHGCYAAGNGGIECGKRGSKAEDLTALPDNYKPVILTEKMDKAWKDLIYELPLPGQGLDGGEENDEEDEVVAE